MASHSLRIIALGLVPIALGACVGLESATGAPIPTAPLVGIDLGSSGRVPQIAALAGEGEGYGRTEPNPFPTDRGSMPGMTHASTDHGAMAGTAHGSIDHGSMPGMRRPAQEQMAAAPVAPPGMQHGSGRGGVQMAHSGHAHVQAAGTINSVDAAARKVNVTHDPIPTIGWPTMTMDFAVAPAVDLNAVTPGTRINFEMEQGQGGMYVIQSIRPAATPAGARRR